MYSLFKCLCDVLQPIFPSGTNKRILYYTTTFLPLFKRGHLTERTFNGSQIGQRNGLSLHKAEKDYGESPCEDVCYLQGWRAEAGLCKGGRPWSLWRLTSGGCVSSTCCRGAAGRGCETAGAQRWRQINTVQVICLNI